MTTRTKSPLIGAMLFLLIYLAVSPIAGAYSTGTAPLPNDPVNEIYAFVVDNPGASYATGIVQALSVLGLAVFLVSPATRVRLTAEPADRRHRQMIAAGWVAVGSMLVTCALTIVEAAIAPDVSASTVGTLNDLSFWAGGVVHVVALGIFVLLLVVKGPWTKRVRVMGWIGTVPALLSIISLFVFYATAFILLGRLLCMIALVVVGVSILRNRTLVTAA